jgi:hypothetical protein
MKDVGASKGLSAFHFVHPGKFRGDALNSDSTIIPALSVSGWCILLLGDWCRKVLILRTYRELTANVLAGNDVHHYNFHIRDHTNEQGGSNSQGQTNLARHYKLTSKNGIEVRVGVVNVVTMRNLFPKLTSSMRLGWSTLADFSKTRAIRGVLRLD